MEAFADECGNRGWGFAAFNNRGHDHITGMHKVDQKNPGGFTYAMGGGGYEKFEECIFDIHAGVDFLVSRGFPEVFVVGHSTGALKVIYSEGTKPHENVAGVVLAGAISDRLGPEVDKEKLSIQIAQMEKLIAEGKGDELVNGLAFFPMTPKRFISLYKKGSAEDVVDYGDENPKMTAFSKILKPTLVIISGQDENLDRPAEDIQKVFDAKTHAKQYKSIIIPSVDHGFTGKEKEAVNIIVSWITTL
jgi:dienelactone hydrolase